MFHTVSHFLYLPLIKTFYSLNGFLDIILQKCNFFFLAYFIYYLLCLFYFFCNVYSVLNIICFAFATYIWSLPVLSDFILSLSSVTCITLYAVHVLSVTGPRGVESARK